MTIMSEGEKKELEEYFQIAEEDRQRVVFTNEYMKILEQKGFVDMDFSDKGPEKKVTLKGRNFQKSISFKLLNIEGKDKIGKNITMQRLCVNNNKGDWVEVFSLIKEDGLKWTEPYLEKKRLQIDITGEFKRFKGNLLEIKLTGEFDEKGYPIIEYGEKADDTLVIPLKNDGLTLEVCQILQHRKAKAIKLANSDNKGTGASTPGRN